MKKIMCALPGVFVVFAANATVWPVVNTVAEFTNTVAKASNGDRIVLAAGKTFDFSTLREYASGTSWGTMGAPDGNGKSCVWFAKWLEIHGEDGTAWNEKTPAQETIVDGGNAARIFYGYTGSGRRSNFKNLTFRNGRAESGKNGGALFFAQNDNYAYATNCVFRGCSADQSGATHCVSAYCCLYDGNRSEERAGAAQGVGNEFVNCVFVGNRAGGTAAGALRENNLTKSIVGCVFSNNVAEASKGGAVYVNAIGSPAGKIVGCRFVGNRSGAEGGAICAVADVEDCVFENNASETNGGAICSPSDFSLSGCVFDGNCATNLGGAVYAPRMTAAVRCVFTNNIAGASGGGVYINSYVSGSFSDCTFHNNTAPGSVDAANAGAQIHNALNLERCRFSGWGDVYARNMVNCEFDGCVYDYFYATHTLEALVRYDTAMGAGLMRNCLFHGCRATRLIATGGVRIDVENCTFADNETSYNTFTAFRSESPVVGSTNVFVNCIFANSAPGQEIAAAAGTMAYDFFATAYKADGRNVLSNCLYWAAGGAVPTSIGGFAAANLLLKSPKFAGADSRYRSVPYYTPCYSSAARNAGLNMDWMAAGADLAGNGRINDGAVDIGCYESYLPAMGFVLSVR